MIILSVISPMYLGGLVDATAQCNCVHVDDNAGFIVIILLKGVTTPAPTASNADDLPWSDVPGSPTSAAATMPSSLDSHMHSDV
jgi:hypothetical protein